jgi:hypothetical protein
MSLDIVTKEWYKEKNHYTAFQTSPQKPFSTKRETEPPGA